MRQLLCCFTLQLFISVFPHQAWAQVTGTFFPTAVGDIQQPGSTPFPQPAPGDMPYFEQAKTTLQGQLQQERRPYIDLCSSYANQSLLAPTGQFDTFTPEIAEFGFFPTLRSEVRFSYIPTIMGEAGLKSPRIFGQEYRGAFRYQPLDRLKLAGQLGLYNFHQSSVSAGGTEVLGAFSAEYALHDRVHLIMGYRRDIVGNTLLSAPGLNLPGTNTLVGRTTQNLGFVILNTRPARKTGVSFYYGGGFIAGSNVQTDPFQQFGLSINQNLYARAPQKHISAINFSYQLLAFNYKYDNSSLGNLALDLQSQPPAIAAAMLASSARGQTQIPAYPGQKQAGVGGYFSPQDFYGNFWGLGMNGHVWGPIYYRGGAGPNIGNVKNTLGRLDQTIFGGSAYAALTARVNRHVQVEYGWYFLQAAEVYRRQVLYSQCKYTF
jgi:hypothetical protein